MSTKPGVPSGVIPPVVTALTPDGDLDIISQEKACAYQLEAGAHALFVAGTTGEGAFLTPDFLSHLTDVVIAYTAGQVPVLVGALAPGTPAVISIVRQAEKAGADGVVVTTPYYGETSPSEITEHFRAVARATSLPVLAYSIPPMTHQPVPLTTVEELFADDTVVGLKDSGRDWDNLAAAIDLGARYDKLVYSGYEPFAGRAVGLGAAGIVASIGNVDPQGIMRLWETASNHLDEATAAQDHLAPLLAGFPSYQVGGVGSQSALIAGIKAMMQELGVLTSRTVVSPLTTLPDDALPMVRDHLRSAGLGTA